ncbi:hypothetical protein LX95_01512 [Mesonia algae]|uniref:Septum formation initiator n=1 Tax=Mesonia algae TaxID=213248 RepID=A0A2W7I2S5_9FLAO|nr:hypothetical protein [Mesonia algae]PZW40449.1 hypothetical protein LX95_01512 [Mesonia algae]
MKKFILITLFFGASNLFAQQQQDSLLVKEIPTIKNNVFIQRQEIDDLTKRLKSQEIINGKHNRSINSLQNENQDLKALNDSLSQLITLNHQNITSNSKNIITNSTELGTKIKQTGENANSKITELDSSLDKNRLYWIIATLVTLLLGGLVYWLLGKRIKSSKIDVETQIRNTKASLEEESVKLDNKLVEVLETQLKLKQEETKVQPTTANEKADHFLALKVADEIIRIQKNLSRMDESTKGLKQLNSSVKRIQDNFASNGYELVEMLGREYNEGMKATVNFVQDEDFEEGKRLITRIIKPQVNYRGTMIQTAQIEVTEA